MARWSIMAVAVILATAGCSDPSLPRPGDTVSPLIVGMSNWNAGERAALQVALVATNWTGKSRELSFFASPENNPVAQIQFYDGGNQVVESLDVELSERC